MELKQGAPPQVDEASRERNPEAPPPTRIDVRVAPKARAPVEEWGKLSATREVMKKRQYKEVVDALKDRKYEDEVVLPVLTGEHWSLKGESAATLRSLYTETCANWRALTDVRFKLLGFLPVASFAALVAILEQGESGPKLAPLHQSAVAVLGLLAVLALWIYERRNTALYDALVGRGRRIEAELGIHTGQFRGRPKSGTLIKHDVAILTIYAASALAWTYGAAAPWLHTIESDARLVTWIKQQTRRSAPAPSHPPAGKVAARLLPLGASRGDE